MRAKELMNDRRGGVMIIGLFMALSLIGALWFIIGMGDAIIFRDRMQEAADAVAFSSAAVHARGMNMIAAMNLVIFALVALYLAMTFLDLIFLLGKNVPYVGGLIYGLHQVYHHTLWRIYLMLSGKVMQVVAIVQAIVGAAAPYGG